jgi:hypothetical protein
MEGYVLGVMVAPRASLHENVERYQERLDNDGKVNKHGGVVDAIVTAGTSLTVENC